MQTREFHLGDILAVITHRLVSPRHMKGLFDILSFMTDDNLSDGELTGVAEKCKPFLLEQHPQLAEVDASGVNPDNWEKWLAEQVEKFGEMLPVSTIP